MASWPTVEAPWLRFCAKVGLTVEGRFATALLKDVTALEAAPQSPAETAEESVSSWPFRLAAWLIESRPAPPPQATRNETAKPIPPAMSARGPKPIRRLTLEANPVGLRLGAFPGVTGLSGTH